MTEVYIADYTKDDLEAIAQIESLSITPPWSYKAICDFSECETSRIIVAKIGNIPVGYITYSVVLDEIQIANVATHPEFRRKGIGEALLTSLKNFAENNKVSVITLEVRFSNEPAIKLYEKCGYEKVGIRKKYYKNPNEDAILMNLTF